MPDIHAPVSPLAAIVTVLITVNLAVFIAFGLDKARARNGGWRLRESTLLVLAFFGGTAGAYAGRHLFRHKTRKQPFNSSLFAIALLHVVLLGGAIGWHLAG